MDTPVSYVAPRRRSVIAALGFFHACRRTSAALSGAARSMKKRRAQSETRQSALANVRWLMDRKYRLMIEREILVAERKEAIRQHRPVGVFDRQLSAITSELLSIG